MVGKLHTEVSKLANYRKWQILKTVTCYSMMLLSCIAVNGVVG
jgi:hypothetical protein